MRGSRPSSCANAEAGLRKLLSGVLVVFAWALVNADNYTHSGMSYRHFQGLRNIMEVDCSGDGLVDSSSDVLTVSLYDPRNNTVIASTNLKNKECTTSAAFSLCIIDGEGHKAKVRTLVLDLGLHESRLFGCNITVTKAGRTQIRSWVIHVKADTIAVSTIAMLTSTSPQVPAVYRDSSSPVPGMSTDNVSELFDIHPGILITALLFLIFFVILSVVLIVMHIKERRRRHYLAEEYDTPLPIKSEYAVPGGVPRPQGEKERILAAGYRSPRPSTSSPLPRHVRKGSGAGSGGSMRYQQTGALGVAFHDEVPGYSAGHSVSVYYAEPWSGVDSETKERVRAGARATPLHSVQIAHDAKAVTSSAPPPEDNN